MSITTQGTVRVLSPLITRLDTGTDVAPRLKSLNGIKLGILDNSKPNADLVLKSAAAVLAQEFNLQVLTYVKPYASRKGNEAEIEAFARGCDAVLTGLGD